MFDLGLYTFHMPLFMLLAGLNVTGSLRRGRRAFLRAKLWTTPMHPWLLALLAIAWLGAFALMPWGGETPYLKPAALPAAACGIAFMLVLARGSAGSVVQSVFVRFGRASMTIYVMHILGTAGARIALTRLHIPQHPAAWSLVYWGACTGVGLGVPLFAHEILARYGGLTPLGLAPRKPAAPRQAPPVIRMA